MNAQPIHRTLAVFLLLGTAAPLLAGEKYSGFLEDYSGLKDDPKASGGKLYVAPGVPLAGYNKVMLDPILVWYDPDSKFQGINPDKLKRVTDELAAALIEKLGNDYPLVTQPGPDVMHLRCAITNVQAKRESLTPLSFTPAGAAKTVAKRATNLDILLKGAVLEAEISDSQTGRRLATVIDSIEASRKGFKKKTSWNEVEEIVDFWAARLRERLDHLHGKE